MPILDARWAGSWYAESTVRTLIALVLGISYASAQAPLTRILASELDRNFTILKKKGDPPPYFMAYEVTETESDVLSASRGALVGQNHAHIRIPRPFAKASGLPPIASTVEPPSSSSA